jgi:Fe-S oxidoreductase
MNERKKERKYPTQEVEPENFLTNEEVHELIRTKNQYKFRQEDYSKLYNCVHCRECGTSDERIILKQKFLKDGNKIEDLDKIKKMFEDYGTPYKNNESRIKVPAGVLEESDTLLYFGCFTSVKTPKYGEHAAEYLLDKGIKFTVLDKEICCGYPILVTGVIDTYNKLVEQNRKLFSKKGFKRIITVCPSCYMVFQKHYSDLDIKIEYYTKYLKPYKAKKKGEISVQHACPLVYDCEPELKNRVETLLTDSGYEVKDIPMFCCGGGVGHQLRKDVAEKIARLRVRDFKGDYVTYYCPDCYWFIKVFGKKEGLDLELKNLFELLTD